MKTICMKSALSRILIGAAIFYLLAPVSATAQKRKTPVKKPVAKRPAETPPKPVHPIRKARAYSKFELALVEEINAARTNPARVIAFLEEYRKALKGDLIFLPHQLPLKTIEGAAAIDEAIDDLKTVEKLPNLLISDILSEAAHLQLQDVEEDASLGHKGKNGSTLKVRLAQFGTAKGKAAENICFRANSARQTLIIFIIDDGVKSRMHRKNVLHTAFKDVGVACGTGKNKESICVTVFAENIKEKDASSSHLEF